MVYIVDEFGTDVTCVSNGRINFENNELEYSFTDNWIGEWIEFVNGEHVINLKNNAKIIIRNQYYDYGQDYDGKPILIYGVCIKQTNFQIQNKDGLEFFQYQPGYQYIITTTGVIGSDGPE